MEELQLSTMLLYFGGALVLCLAGIFALGWFIDVQSHARRWMLALLYPIIVGAITVSAILSNRNVTTASYELMSSTATDSSTTTWILRVATVLILCICLARLISVSQTSESRGRHGKALFLAFMLFYVTNVVLNNIFGTRPVFDQKLIYPGLIFTTLYFSRNKDIRFPIEAAKIALALFFIGCLLVAVAMPQLALQKDYIGWIPGMTTRLWGLGSNPNSIGPMALVFLLLIAHKPFASRMVQIVAVALGLAVLVLSQSKTAWMSALLAFPIIWWARLVYAPAAGKRPGAAPYSVRAFSGPILVCLLGLLAAIGGVVYTIFSSEIAMLTGREDVSTLTGRTAIWAVAIETWSMNPLFGYGAAMWDDQFRQMIGMNFAYSAHNQFLQTLSMSGLLGLAGLAVYLCVLLRYSIMANKTTGGLSLALYSFLVVRCFTEAPMSLSAVYSGEFLTHMLLFSLVLNKVGEAQPARYSHADYPMPHMQWR
jgi:O-antigen ligase